MKKLNSIILAEGRTMPEKRTEEGKRKKYLYDAEYIKKNMKQFGFKLNRITEADLIEHIAKHPNTCVYFKNLVRDDMNKNK